MNDIKIIAAIYHEYYYMYGVLLNALMTAFSRQKDISFEFEHLISSVIEKMYGGYSAAASNFHRMQENNPDWVEAITGHDTANTPDQSISVLLDKMKEIVMVYSERRKFLDMLNHIIYAAKKECHLCPYFLTSVYEIQETMMDLCRDTLLAFHDKKIELMYLGTSPYKYFDKELVHIIEDMDTQDYVCISTYYEELHLMP